MPRALLLALAVLAASLAAFLLWPEPRTENADSIAPRAAAAAGRDAAQSTLATPSVDAPAERVAAEVPARPEDDPPAAEPAEPEAPLDYDADAKETLELRIVDSAGGPVEGAVVSIGGMRSSASPGSWISYRGTPPKGTSDANGRVDLTHVVWVDQDGLLTGVDLSVEHPEFVPFRNASFKLDQSEVVLQRGATVVVTGWHRDPSATIFDVDIQLDRDSGLGGEAWKTLDDGRLATSRLEPGVHYVAIAHDHPEHGELVSAPHRFELGAVGWETIHLELIGPLTLVGELDPRVPRPVQRGSLRVVIRSGGLRREPTLTRTRDVEVEPDGTFVVEDVRPGRAFLVAIADGWTSAKLPPPDLEEAGIRLGDGATEAEKLEALANADDRHHTYPWLDLPQVAPPFVVPMVQTGDLEVTVLGPTGAPVTDAVIFANPNYSIRGVGSNIVPGRKWSAGTDENGIARVVDLPPDGALAVGVSANDHQMTAEDRQRFPSVAVPAGGTAELEVTLEAKPKR